MRLRILKYARIAVIFSIVVYFKSYADISTAALKESPKLQDVMHSFVKDLVHAKAFEHPVEDPPLEADKIKITRALERLSLSVRNLKESSLPKSSGHTISLRALQQHVNDMDTARHSANPYYARWMINATTSICLMCHTQTPSSSRSLDIPGPFAMPKNADQKFSQAEFLFMTRQFGKSIEYFDDLIKNYPQNELNIAMLDISLRRELAYFARVVRNPNDGIVHLELALKNDKIPPAVRKNVEAWKALFREWANEPKLHVNQTAASTLQFARSQMRKTLWDRMIDAYDPRVVTHLRVSGEIYSYLVSNPQSKETPELLLWLGRCENALNDKLFFTLGDLYYRECLERYPRSNVARECYQELENSVKKVYLGTNGLDLPPFVLEELRSYRIKIKLDP